VPDDPTFAEFVGHGLLAIAIASVGLLILTTLSALIVAPSSSGMSWVTFCRRAGK
jgi:hypothetical protein